MEGEKSEVAKNPVLELMAKRDRERKLANEKNQKARQLKSEHEGLGYFEGIFDKKVSEIENRVSAIQPSNDVSFLQEEFNSIGRELQELQKYFTSSTIFLSDHKIKTCQNVINQLISKTDETKLKLLPKKKFGFKSKSTKTTETAVKVKNEAKIDDFKNTRKEFQWTDSNKSNQVLRYEGDQVNGQDLTFKDMQNCVIFIKGHAGSLQMSQMKSCLVLSGAVSRSVFANSCEDCTFSFSCQQLRLHSSSSCNIYILVTSRAIIEDCKEICFAPNSYTYEDYEQDIKSSGLDSSCNNWTDVGDFNWLSTDKPSPNWHEIAESDRVSDWSRFIEDFIKAHDCK